MLNTYLSKLIIINFLNSFNRHPHANEYEGVNIPKLLESGCFYLDEHCPLTLLELTPYTDVL